MHDFHRQVGGHVRHVVFMKRPAPVLDCTDLVVFKAMFNRTKDWADIEEMLAARTVDSERALLWLNRLLGTSDEVTLRFAAVTDRSAP